MFSFFHFLFIDSLIFIRFPDVLYLYLFVYKPSHAIDKSESHKIIKWKEKPLQMDRYD